MTMMRHMDEVGNGKWSVGLVVLQKKVGRKLGRDAGAELLRHYSTF